MVAISKLRKKGKEIHCCFKIATSFFKKNRWKNVRIITSNKNFVLVKEIGLRIKSISDNKYMSYFECNLNINVITKEST